MDRVPTPVLDEKEIKAPKTTKPVFSENKNKFLKIGVIIIIVLVILMGGLLTYQKAIAPALVKPTPTPVATDPAWKTKSESNVNNFLDLWIKSIGTTNSVEYSTQARNYLTVAAQAKILTYKNSRGILITDVSDQLTTFVGAEAPTSYSISSITQIDDKTVDVSVTFTNETTSTKIFKTKSEGEVWLIDSARNWGEN